MPLRPLSCRRWFEPRTPAGRTPARSRESRQREVGEDSTGLSRIRTLLRYDSTEELAQNGVRREAFT